MLYPSFEAYEQSGFRPRVCIFGSGPAGITLARRLASLEIPSLVVEAGGLDVTPESQDFYRGRNAGDPYHDLHTARLRAFGGTSGHWSGWCRHLDAVDFMARPEVGSPGWPIAREALDRYRSETEDILEIAPIPADGQVNDDLAEVHFRFSPPVRFGQKYRQAFQDAGRMGLVLNTALQTFVPGEGRIASATLRDEEGRERTLLADVYCLCTGGIENSRLLLWSNDRYGGAVVPNTTALGKYWMEHPHFYVGESLLVTHRNEGHGAGRFYAPTASAMARYRIGNGSLRHIPLTGELSRTRRLLMQGLCAAPQFFGQLAAEFGRDLSCIKAMPVKMAWEQLPRADSHVALDTTLDEHGVPRVRLHWRKSPLERHTAFTIARLYGEHLVRRNAGRLRLSNWITAEAPYPTDDELGGFHHLGGTRMSGSPGDGIVDPDCKVFGMDNLYVGGSSVFPTGGHANPTYTIVQLALRLGDHLAQRWGARLAQT